MSKVEAGESLDAAADGPDKLDRGRFIARAGGTLLAAGVAGSLVGTATAGTLRRSGRRAKPFAGKSVTVAVGSFMSSGVTMFKDAWEKKTGGTVNVVEIPFGDLYQRLFTAFSSGGGQFDVAVYAANWIPEFAEAGHLLPLDSYYRKKENWGSVLPKTKTIMYVGGKRYSVPMDGDVIFGYYRKDAVDNPKHAAGFKKKYGYNLAPPTTWKQYRDIAEHFNGWDWSGTGKKGYGVLEAQKPKDVAPFILTARATAYAAHPGFKAGLFFDPNTMEPQVGNPGWVQALKDWAEIKKFGPAEMATYGGGDVRGNFVAGHYALAIDWADIGIIAQDEKSSIIKGKLGYFVLPGSNRVYHGGKKRWDTVKTPNHGPYLGWGGWHGSIAKGSKNPDAAWDFLNFIDSTPNSFRAVTTPGTARNPYRKEHFARPAAWVTAPVHYKDPAPYLKTQLKSMNHPNAQFDLRIPKAGRYFEVLDNWLQQTLAGNMDAEKALAKAADEWRQITKDAGIAKQKALYRELYGL